MPTGVYTRTEEARRNLSVAHKGQIPWNKDKYRSEETKRKISRTLMGRSLNHRLNCQCCICKVKRGEGVHKTYEERFGVLEAERIRRKQSFLRIGKKYFHKEDCQCISCKSRRGEIKILSEDHKKNIGAGVKNSLSDHKVNCQCSICKSRRGEEIIHKPNCQCCYCKVARGEMSGKNHPNWKDGKSFEPYSLEFNNKLKNNIRIRDDHICQFCGVGENGKAHDVHHVDYNKKNTGGYNLVTLCHSCNAIANFGRNKWKFLFQTLQEIRLVCFGGVK